MTTTIRACFSAFLACTASCLLAPAFAQQSAAGSFHFTVTSDLHLRTDYYGHVLDAMVAHCDGMGAFQVSCGDLVNKGHESPQPLRDLLDAKFGRTARWFTAVGNHDAGQAETRAAMAWRYAAFESGHGVRTPLREIVTRAGPAGTTATTYSWDHANAHFVVLNQYWDGGIAAGSDTATKGDIVPALRTWLEADLAANTRPFVFVFGHEPAYPQFRHEMDSLNAQPENRDAFWALLARHRVQAFICGHIHYYYKEQHDGVWQISDGNAGNGSSPKYQAFLDITVGVKSAVVRVWQNEADGGTDWRLADTISLAAVSRGAVRAGAD